MVKLSQCMIVKNEEKNIGKALGWAKPVAFEQIVVDTGSTDKTVEIAQQMGAKVYHFEWINDFGTAKNYAIDKATGDWIAFLDADEYLSTEDANKLIKMLEHLNNNPKQYANTTILNMPWVQLNDDNEAGNISEQTRVFRNIKEIRYVGKIHEQISVYGDIMFVDDIAIMHTGYAESEVLEKGKTERNIGMLRADLAEKPDDMKVKAHLADALVTRIVLDNFTNEEDITEVDALYGEVIDSNATIPKLLKKKAFLYFLTKVQDDPEKIEEYRKMCEKALIEFPDDIEFSYFHACALNKMGEYNKAIDVLQKLELKLSSTSRHEAGINVEIMSDPRAIYGQALLAAQGLGDVKSVVNYATILLVSDKTQQNILSPYIHTLLKNGAGGDEVLGLLGNIYDISSPNDLLLIARAAKSCGAIEFAGLVMELAREMMGK